jgi:hypothetical protein
MRLRFVNYSHTAFRPVAPTYANVTLNPTIQQSQPVMRNLQAEVRSPVFDASEPAAAISRPVATPQEIPQVEAPAVELPANPMASPAPIESAVAESGRKRRSDFGKIRGPRESSKVTLNR